MLIVIGLMLGVFLGVVLSVAVWATGRRPYLRVDIERHTTHEVVHEFHPHLSCGGRCDRRPVEIARDWQVMPTVTAHGRVLQPAQVREIDR